MQSDKERSDLQATLRVTKSELQRKKDEVIGLKDEIKTLKPQKAHPVSILWETAPTSASPAERDYQDSVDSCQRFYKTILTP